MSNGQSQKGKPSEKPLPGSPSSPNPATKPPPVRPGDGKRPPTPPAVVPNLFRRWDWIAFWITTLVVFLGYFYTLAPDVTLEDSGELAVASFYAGVPHPPGYPVW